MKTAVPIAADKARPDLSKARIAGGLYLVAAVAAVSAEFFSKGRMNPLVAVGVPVVCYAVVSVLLFLMLRSVSALSALVAMVTNLVGLALEALRWQPAGFNMAMVFHGLFCLLTGYLLFQGRLIPRVCAGLMGAAGVVWLMYLDPPFARSLAPANSLFGLLCEAIPMLWLLIVGSPSAWRR